MLLRARNSTPTPPTGNISHPYSKYPPANRWMDMHMLLINLITIYQGRIPTLTHTQHHAESLSRVYLKYGITGELDTYVTNLIRNLTNHTHITHRTPRTRRNKHTQLTSNTKPKQASPSPTTTTRKRPHTLTHIQLHYQLPPLAPTHNPPKKARHRDVTTPHTYPAIPRSTSDRPSHKKIPVTTRTTHPKRKPRNT